MVVYVQSRGPFRYKITGDNAELAAQEFESRMNVIYESDLNGPEIAESIYYLRKELISRFGVLISIHGPA
ncbi:MAG: hypothetical protein AB7D36_11130 [Oscillospiraceae bacterium]